MTSTKVRERILRRTDRSGECWLWTGPLDRHGYAEIKISGRQRLAHRVAYETFIGPIPDGLVIDHRCRVRHCQNPDHLEPVTNRENLLRGVGVAAQNATKTHCPQGHPYDEANTIIRPRGSRRCRACHNASTNRKVRNR
ncbi:HNH endonuclease signature motif containing protein [Streptomyces massasporeus]|uniref:HNH endonuclease signature motif containing protein n=1 Tax=Streptomyces massasporeus TaxID=67324 RepID=UPI0036A61848